MRGAVALLLSLFFALIVMCVSVASNGAAGGERDPHVAAKGTSILTTAQTQSSTLSPTGSPTPLSPVPCCTMRNIRQQSLHIMGSNVTCEMRHERVAPTSSPVQVFEFTFRAGNVTLPSSVASPILTLTPTPTPLEIRIRENESYIIPTISVEINNETITVTETEVRLKTTTAALIKRGIVNEYIKYFEPEFETKTPILIAPSALRAAVLRVTTETSVSDREFDMIIKIKNIGGVEARNISLTMNTPSGFERIALVGARSVGTTIKWEGEKLKPGDIHIINYKLQFKEELKGDLEFPVSLSWKDNVNKWLMEFILRIPLRIFAEIPRLEEKLAIARIFNFYYITLHIIIIFAIGILLVISLINRQREKERERRNK